MDRSGARSIAPLALAALGVVFGDLGTSPLYALQEAFVGPHAIDANRADVLGIISLFLWSLVLVVSVKYVVFLMRADNRGEGGILALLALTGARAGRRYAAVVIVLGLFGAALLYGDGVITPAISVLSAVEGLKVASPALEHAVIPITIVILVGLFLVQRFGSGRVGRFFGPVLALWFVTIAALGALAIRRDPSVLAALSPTYAVGYFVRHGLRGVPILGAVVLCLTGGEALYADMGHFGARPIRLAWFGLVLPALVLSYLGQGAAVLADPAVATRPFYSAAPAAALYPLVVLATAATVIASQALITAVFSLTRQAVQLGYWPRARVVHTSAEEQGQVYLPGFNWTVMLATCALVLAFRSSGALASAFGLAVSGTMLITTILFTLVVRRRWRWPWPALALFAAVFVTVDLAFLVANTFKIAGGGWLPLAIGGGMLVLMEVWAYGRARLRRRLAERQFALDEFLESFGLSPPVRVPGTAVFLTGQTDGAPLALLHYLKHARSLHQKVVLLSVMTEDVPHVAPGERVVVRELSHGFWQVIGSYGFMESPDVPALLRLVEERGLATAGATFFLGRESVVACRGNWRGWRERLFSFMHHNARPAAEFFGIPPNQVLEVGAQVEL
ncbi:MAG TPA: potassium transporter Kup [Kofleriaceae bacterium]|nr:potassium transporter Kup [Kofleriaceae bacterium]